ncbi:MAG TPA: hypothetical protein VGT24_01450 [Candidatus Acidoferrales bacterium]|nr:hypothetical protein [Candidatus Acidoferrales bacterium]
MRPNDTLDDAETVATRAVQSSAETKIDSNTPGPRWKFWAARLIIVAATALLASFTWGHWGDFQIDNGREIYVPAAILQGKLLFRDIWYMYGPLAPYAQALLFRIFGIRLTVLYVFGLALAAGSALLAFEVGCQLGLEIIPTMVAPFIFLSEGFHPFIFNVVFPYSYAAALAVFLGWAFLYFTIRQILRRRLPDLFIAALLVSLALLTKQEFGIACLAVLAFEIAGSYWVDGSFAGFRKNLFVCLAGLTPAVAGYGWFVWKLSAKVVFFDNWISTPGTFYMKTFGMFMIPAQGFRFIPHEILQMTEMAALAVMIWLVIALANGMGIKMWKSRPVLLLLILLADLLLAYVSVFGANEWPHFVKRYLREAVFPHGLFFVALLFTLQAIWKLWQRKDYAQSLAEAALGIYATLSSLRVMLRLFPSAYNYGVFFNVPVFLIFVIVLVRMARWAGQSLEPGNRKTLVACILGAEAILAAIMFLPNPGLLPAPLQTDIGTFYTHRDISILFPEIISFMKTHTRNGKDILVLPEPPSLYTFAGMQSPTRWYSLLPGVVAPDQERVFIQEAASSDVRYVLISNRPMPEYRVTTFGQGYDEVIFQWITTNFRKVGQFGPLPNNLPNAYVMNIFERKDLPQGP